MRHRRLAGIPQLDRLVRGDLQPDRDRLTLGSRADVDAVVVDGRVVVLGGVFQLADEASIVSAGTAAIKKIWDLPEAQNAFRRDLFNES